MVVGRSPDGLGTLIPLAQGTAVTDRVCMVPSTVAWSQLENIKFPAIFYRRKGVIRNACIFLDSNHRPLVIQTLHNHTKARSPKGIDRIAENNNVALRAASTYIVGTRYFKPFHCSMAVGRICAAGSTKPLLAPCPGRSSTVHENSDLDTSCR